MLPLVTQDNRTFNICPSRPWHDKTVPPKTSKRVNSHAKHLFRLRTSSESGRKPEKHSSDVHDIRYLGNKVPCGDMGVKEGDFGGPIDLEDRREG